MSKFSHDGQGYDNTSTFSLKTAKLITHNYHLKTVFRGKLPVLVSLKLQWLISSSAIIETQHKNYGEKSIGKY